MSDSQTRLDVLIDVFELVGQPARVLPKIKPPQLVDAIVQEFRELEYLADDPSSYYLVRADDQTPLDDEVEIGRQQPSVGARLLLLERALPAPAGALPLSQRVYLREQSTGKVHRLHWQPAIIGRRVEGQTYGEAFPDGPGWVAVDLQSFPTGLRVSRRHLLIRETDGQVTIENLARNLATLQRTGGVQIPIGADRIPLLADDIILLERSRIEFKVIIRPRQTGALQEHTGREIVDDAEPTALQVAPETATGEESGARRTNHG